MPFYKNLNPKFYDNGSSRNARQDSTFHISLVKVSFEYLVILNCMTKPIVLLWTDALQPSVWAEDKSFLTSGRRHRCPGRSKNFLQIKGGKRKDPICLPWRAQLRWKLWKCLKLPSARGESGKHENLLRVSEGLGLETFKKLRTGLIGAGTST